MTQPNQAGSLGAVVENAWRDIATAPRDGTRFLALNHDGELWVATYDKYGRILFRSNERREPRRFVIHHIDGKKLLEEDEEYARANEEWSNHWTIWTRLYEFQPTHWLPLPSLPTPPEAV